MSNALRWAMAGALAVGAIAYGLARQRTEPSGPLVAVAEPPSSPARLASGLEAELRMADAALQSGRRSVAVAALDSAQRVAIVLAHATGESAAPRRELVQQARALLRQGEIEQAQQLVAWLANAPPSSRGPAKAPMFGSKQAARYVGASVIDAVGQRIGEVRAVSAHGVELALETGSPARPTGLPARMRLPASALVFGPHSLLGTDFVAAPSLNPRALRVCADPNNLPFSNRAGQGFENQLAALLARDLHAELSYEWSPQRRGFIRRTLRAGRCDVIMALPAGFERVLTTRPVYRSGYAFVYGVNTPPVHSLDSPALQSLRIGVPLVGDDGSNPPPVAALVQRDLVRNLRGYSVFGDYRAESPPAELVRAVQRNDVDLAIAWGPLAGYYARRASPPLNVELLPPGEAPPGLPFVFDIALAVRRDAPELRAELDAALARHQREIGELLARFDVPRL